MELRHQRDYVVKDIPLSDPSRMRRGLTCDNDDAFRHALRDLVQGVFMMDRRSREKALMIFRLLDE